MNLNFNVCKGGNCSIILTDNSQYIKENNYQVILSLSEFKRSECTCFCIIKRHSKDSETVEDILEMTSQQVQLDLSEDGWVTFTQLIVPSKKVIDRYIEQYKSEKLLYFCNDSKIYKYILNSDETYSPIEVSIEELLELNINCTSVLKYEQNFFGVCQLEQCYINYCNKIIDNGLCNRCASKSADTDLIYNRDLVWMVLNVIKYLVEKGDFAEAQHILEEINGCNGLCSNNANDSMPNRGCGCKH